LRWFGIGPGEICYAYVWGPLSIGKYFVTRFMFGLTKKINFIDFKKLKLRRG